MSPTMRCRLCVHVDGAALLRRGAEPDPVDVALAAERAGADRVAVHLREVRGAVKDRDVELLRRLAKTEFVLEIAPTQDMLAVALEVQPDAVTLVAEHREEIGTEAGLDAIQHRDAIQRAVRLLGDAGISAGLFVDPDLDQVRAAHKSDARAVELHAGRYAEARSFQERSEELARLRNAAKAARKVGMDVGVGRGLTKHNLLPVARISEISQVGVGHGLLARAVFVGIDDAVRDWVGLLREARIDLLRG
jgi:pyridoxine 5-phosphate synthase